MMELTKELVEKLADENITVREHNQIQGIITDKVDKIWRFIIQASGRKLDWWAFSNDEYDGEGNGSSGGEFDYDHDKDFINIEGKNSYWSNPYYQYNEGFPTCFLWEDYEAIIQQHVKDCKEKVEVAKVKAQEKKAKKTKEKAELVKSIKSKLTPQELKVVKFV